MKPESAARMRDSLDAKFRSQAVAGNMNASQIRRRFVFQRVLRRLGAAGDWVLKGGFLLEVRIPVGARSTKDMDFATSPAESSDELLDRVEEALKSDPDEDFLTFSVEHLRANRRDRQGLASWSVTVRAVLDGRLFDQVKLDIAERLDEIEGGTELLTVRPVVNVEGLAAVTLPAVDVCQHAAEKFHALCLEFDDGRPNTRTKDLVDIVLLYEAGLIPDARLTARLIWVFEHRDGQVPPPALPRIPQSWDTDYRALTADLAIEIKTAEEAYVLAQKLYQDAVSGVLAARNEGRD